MRLKIVGSGIAAITTAAVFAEVGHNVSLHFFGEHGDTAEQKLLHQVKHNSTTGAAAAFWTPFAVGDYKRVWALKTLIRYASQAEHRDHPGNKGVFWGRLNIFGRSRNELLNECQNSLWWSKLPCTFWGDGQPEIEKLNEPVVVSEIPFTHCFSARVPIIDMSRYLPWFVEYISQLGVNLIAMDRYATPEFCRDSRDFDAISLCAGGWTPQLMEEKDEELFGLTGHLLSGVVTHKGHKAGEVNLAHMPDKQRPVYSVSTMESDRIWIGGTAFHSTFESADKGVPSADDSENSRMLKECEELLQTAISPVDDTRTGIRPYRSSVRVELAGDAVKVPLCVNYGHGGAGISLAWGCAEEVLSLLEEESRITAMAHYAVHGVP